MQLLIYIGISCYLLCTDTDADRYYFVHHEMQGICLVQQVMDEKELRYVLNEPKEFVNDVAFVRRRLRDLQYAPMAWEAARFVEQRESINQLVLANRQYKHFMQQMYEVHHAAWMEKAIEEAERLYQAWDWLRDAKSEYYFIHIRRQALAKLKAMIGDDAWLRGEMVPHVPIWRFVEVR